MRIYTFFITPHRVLIDKYKTKSCAQYKKDEIQKSNKNSSAIFNISAGIILPAESPCSASTTASFDILAARSLETIANAALGLPVTLTPEAFRGRDNLVTSGNGGRPSRHLRDLHSTSFRTNRPRHSLTGYPTALEDAAGPTFVVVAVVVAVVVVALVGYLFNRCT